MKRFPLTATIFMTLSGLLAVGSHAPYVKQTKNSISRSIASEKTHVKKEIFLSPFKDIHQEALLSFEELKIEDLPQKQLKQMRKENAKRLQELKKEKKKLIESLKLSPEKTDLALDQVKEEFKIVQNKLLSIKEKLGEQKKNKKKEEKAYIEKICLQEEKIQDLESKVNDLIQDKKDILEKFENKVAELKKDREEKQENEESAFPGYGLPGFSSGIGGYGLSSSSYMVPLIMRRLHVRTSYAELFQQQLLQNQLNKGFGHFGRDSYYGSSAQSQAPVVNNYYINGDRTQGIQGQEKAFSNNYSLFQRPEQNQRNVPGFEYQRQIVPTYRKERNPAFDHGFSFGETPSQASRHMN